MCTKWPALAWICALRELLVNSAAHQLPTVTDDVITDKGITSPCHVRGCYSAPLRYVIISAWQTPLIFDDVNFWTSLRDWNSNCSKKLIQSFWQFVDWTLKTVKSCPFYTLVFSFNDIWVNSMTVTQWSEINWTVTFCVTLPYCLPHRSEYSTAEEEPKHYCYF